MFNMYATDGKMNKKECASYVDGVTKSYCTASDGRVSRMFDQYRSNKDSKQEYLVVEDFLKFYKDSSMDKP